MATARAPYGIDIADNCQNCRLRGEDFFCQLPASSLRPFDSISYAAAYPKDAVIFVEGQTPRGIYVICRGRVKLSVTSASGRTLIVRIAGPGEVLGLSSTVLGRAYQVTAESLEPCQLNFVKTEDFKKLLQKDAEACFRVAEHLSDEYNDACREIGSLGLSHSASERLAALLLDWDSHHSGGEQRPVRLTLTHEEMAQMIGTSRETVTRLLAKFKERQFISLKGSMLIVRNRAGLQAVCTDGGFAE